MDDGIPSWDNENENCAGIFSVISVENGKLFHDSTIAHTRHLICFILISTARNNRYYYGDE